MPAQKYTAIYEDLKQKIEEGLCAAIKCRWAACLRERS